MQGLWKIGYIVAIERIENIPVDYQLVLGFVIRHISTPPNNQMLRTLVHSVILVENA